MAEKPKKPAKPTPPKRSRPAAPAPAPRWTPAAIKALRDKLGLLQRDAAAYLRISPQLWGDWEAGHRAPVPAMQLLLEQLEAGKLPVPE